MRKWNAVLSVCILLLFLVHMIAGGFQLAGVLPGGSRWLKITAWVMTALVAVHAVIGIKLTVDTCIAGKKAGVSYLRENRLFWVRRVSGFAILLLLMSHLLIFMNTGGEIVRLHLFAGAQLTSQLLLAAAAAVHVLSNIRPLMLGLGMRSFREFLADLLLILAVLLLLAGLAFFVYYLRWNVL